MSEPTTSPFPDRPTPISQKAFAESYGGTLICCFFAILFYGVSLLQTYMYFLKYPKDTTWMKLLVLIVTVLGTAQIILVCATIYRYLIVSYTDPSVLAGGTPVIFTGVILGYLVCIMVQTFFARMIYHLMKGMKRYLLITGFVLFILSEFAFGMCWVVKEFQSTTLAELAPWAPKLLVPLRILRMVSDGATTLSLCLILFDAKIQFKPSMKLVRTIIIYSINRFVLTTIVGSVQTILILINPHSISVLSIEFISLHLYINSLLAALNSRNRVRGSGRPSSSYISSEEIRPTPTSVNLPGMSSPISPADTNSPQTPKSPHSLPSPISRSADEYPSLRQTLRKGLKINVETESYVMKDIETP
ncbi:hypothetical protein D9758_012479 [Tetrapyrgos nigripes]|uniref:DUF6534 domain-containing protein n=1 Tax=Tetrapyrgos nigripes TaxID=182062 RepID=A0A8H5FV79_9AGAR|nr:hypothetical protein D9758_012479 [Tetrapyrgos nigripes]